MSAVLLLHLRICVYLNISIMYILVSIMSTKKASISLSVDAIMGSVIDFWTHALKTSVTSFKLFA